MSIRLSGYGNVATSLTSKSHIEIILLVLQAFLVLFLWPHDWIPLGRLNNVTGVRSQGTLLRLVAVALVQSVPFTFALLFSLLRFGRPYPHWLYMGLSISYGLIFVGQIRASWIPSFSLGNRTCRRLSDDVQQMFSNTHHFLPIRKGLSRTPRTSCSIWQPQPCCSFFSRAEDG